MTYQQCNDSLLPGFNQVADHLVVKVLYWFPLRNGKHKDRNTIIMIIMWYLGNIILYNIYSRYNIISIMYNNIIMYSLHRQKFKPLRTQTQFALD